MLSLSRTRVEAEYQYASNKTQWGINQTAGGEEETAQHEPEERKEKKRDMGLNINIVSS